jgi:hypothetical protein
MSENICLHTWRFMYESTAIKIPLYSIPHFSLTITCCPVRPFRKGLGLIWAWHNNTQHNTINLLCNLKWIQITPICVIAPLTHSLTHSLTTLYHSAPAPAPHYIITALHYITHTAPLAHVYIHYMEAHTKRSTIDSTATSLMSWCMQLQMQLLLLLLTHSLTHSLPTHTHSLTHTHTHTNTHSHPYLPTCLTLDLTGNHWCRMKK